MAAGYLIDSAAADIDHQLDNCCIDDHQRAAADINDDHQHMDDAQTQLDDCIGHMDHGHRTASNHDADPDPWHLDADGLAAHPAEQPDLDGVDDEQHGAHADGDLARQHQDRLRVGRQLAHQSGLAKTFTGKVKLLA